MPYTSKASLDLNRVFSNCGLNTSPKLRAYTPVLSSLCSLGVLGLFLRRLSSLDAFRIYDLWRSCSACPVGQPMDQWPRSAVPLVLRGPSPQTLEHFR